MIDLPENTTDMREEHLDKLECLASEPGSVFSGKVVIRLIAQIRAEWHDVSAMCSEVSQVYDHVTGGRVSKPNTIAADVIEQADSYFWSHLSEVKAEMEADGE